MTSSPMPMSKRDRDLFGRPLPGSPMNGSGNISISDEISRIKMESFKKLKPTCVSLMGIAGQRPTSHSSHTSLLLELDSTIKSLPKEAFTSSMINYILFPITNILRQVSSPPSSSSSTFPESSPSPSSSSTSSTSSTSPPEIPDNFLEAIFKLLSTVVRIWRGTEGGIEVPAWEQLWRFVMIVLGPRFGLGGGGQGMASNAKGHSHSKGKGKGREIDQEVQIQAVNLLGALLDPRLDQYDDVDGLNTSTYPTPSMRLLFSTTKSALLPTLFQTISVLIEISSPSPPNHRLQLAALRLLRPLVKNYLAGRHELLASVLPGLVSAASKLILSEAKRLNGDVGVECLALIGDVVGATLNDEDLRKLRVLRSVVDDLSQFSEWEKSTDGDTTALAPPPSPSPSSASSSTPPPDPFPPLSASYLAFTSAHLQSAITPILSTISSHTSAQVREATANLSFELISRCNQSLPLLLPHFLTTLLRLSMDEFDSVRHDAKRKIRLLFEDTGTQLALDTVLVDLLSNAMNSLPRLIVSQQDSKVEELVLLITSVAQMTSDTLSTVTQTSSRNVIADLLGPAGNVERWGWSLLDCLEFGKPPGWSGSATSASRLALRGWEQGLARGWEQGLISDAMIVDDDRPIFDQVAADQAFPMVPLRYVESEKTCKFIKSMLVALGSAGGESALHSVEYFSLYAKINRRNHIAQSASALWVSQNLLQGIIESQEAGVEGKIGKRSRKMAREITKTVVAIDEEEDYEDEDLDDGEELNRNNKEGSSLDDAFMPVERSKGLNALTTLLDKNPLPSTSASKQSRQLHIQAQKSLLTSMSLSTLSLTSRILGTSFRPLLLNTLYTVLSHLSSPQTLIQEYANVSLINTAYHTGYASPQNLVLDNVDYVINVVSQRLTYSRLSSQAPLVLISMIKLVGPEIVPLVHDVVDEIFDALDDFHGYEVLASTLLAVLVTLIEVMANETLSEGLSKERIKKKAEFRRIENPPNPAADFERFFKWYDERSLRNREVIEDVLGRAPQHAWGQEKSEEELSENEEQASAAQDNTEEPPPTRSQQICIQILSKSINFLTHSSPFLRSKILSLITHSIPVLANGNRESDLLPIIDKSWSIIINRLDDEYPYVTIEAIGVIASLSEYVGDFMSRRILDQAWPKFKRLLKNQYEIDRQSALARKKGILGTESSHTHSHRFYLNILRTCANVVEEVPVDDKILWEMMVGLRALLDERVHEQLQLEAMRLYKLLGERDGDALWVVLSSSLGSGDQQGIWAYLQDENMDIAENASKLLSII